MATPPADSPQRPRLLAEVRRVAKAVRLSPRTAQAYAGWVRRLVRWAGTRHPLEIPDSEVARFLTTLVTHHNFSPTSQVQARSAQLFLYGRVLGRDIELPGHLERIHTPRGVPVVLTREEVKGVGVQLPFALAKKYPNAPADLRWQWSSCARRCAPSLPAPCDALHPCADPGRWRAESGRCLAGPGVEPPTGCLIACVGAAMGSP